MHIFKKKNYWKKNVFLENLKLFITLAVKLLELNFHYKFLYPGTKYIGDMKFLPFL